MDSSKQDPAIQPVLAAPKTSTDSVGDSDIRFVWIHRRTDVCMSAQLDHVTLEVELATERCLYCGSVITPETHPEHVIARYGLGVYCDSQCELDRAREM